MQKAIKPLIGIGVTLLVGILLYSSAYIVSEGRQAIVTQFGRPIGEPITSAGVHFKMPFVKDVRYVDKRILTWDGDVNEIPTKDKKFIEVDTTARWRIVDALKFIQTVQNERGARTRLDAILDGTTRDVISSNNLVEAVRNTNSIVERIEARKKELEKAAQDGIESLEVVEEEVFGDIEKIQKGREALSAVIAEGASKGLLDFGIEIIDVQLRRISYESGVEEKVYQRMISERQRIAEKIRSLGKAEQAKIQGRLSRDLQEIESAAYQKSQTIQGKADAEATALYAKAFKGNADFYEFMRTMEAYKESLKGKTEFIFSSDSTFLKKLKSDRL